MPFIPVAIWAVILSFWRKWVELAARTTVVFAALIGQFCLTPARESGPSIVDSFGVWPVACTSRRATRASHQLDCHRLSCISTRLLCFFLVCIKCLHCIWPFPFDSKGRRCSYFSVVVDHQLLSCWELCEHTQAHASCAFSITQRPK